MRLQEYLILLIIGLVLFASSCNSKKQNILTPKERAWLHAHPNIKIAVSSTFPPFQFTDENNKSVGVSVDILNLLEKKINYQFEKIYFTNWKEILNAGKTKKVDVILEIQETTDRKTYFHFTKPFITIPQVIIMRKSSAEHITIDEMENLRIGVVDNYAVHEYLTNLYPELDLYPLSDDLTCLLALSTQKIDAVITQQGYAIYEIHKEVLSNLHIVGNTGYDNELGFAIRKDWAILTRIMDKGLARISGKEHNSIFNHYIPIQATPFWQKTIFWLVIVIICLAFTLSLPIIYLWNRSLRRRVEIKTHQLNKAKEKAEESNQLKSSFLANISHEIRTPLNAIQGFSELLSNENTDIKQKKDYAAIINTNCKSLTNLIDEILDLSKIESGLISIKNEKFDLIKCIQEVVAVNIQKIQENKTIQIQFLNQLQREKLEINADPFRFKQILNNLLSNAIKFTKDGNITVEASYYGSSELLFCVKDTGIGIEESSVHLVFDRFTKVEKDPSVLYRGSGLGLNICKKLLELMNGKIWVKSTMGVGSSFYFTLPVN